MKQTRANSHLALSRRELLGTGAAAVGAAMAAHTVETSVAAAPAVKLGPELYRSIGVRPIINARGTFTIITGSTSLTEVKQAMEEASRHYVQLDELMEAVGKRLAELTGAEWGIVTAGCAAAATAATCAAVAGSDPEKMQRLPILDGLKNEVVIPRYSRNVYDHAVRMVGVRMVTTATLADLEAAFTPRTAMVYVLAGQEDAGPFGLEPIARAAHKHGVPVFVDAAAENLDAKYFLDRGADLVAYSGGKAIRGPQCAGLLLGRKDLCQAAWINSAPHHAFARSLKVGKEEIMGMLTAVEMWQRRDHKAEWKQWEAWNAEVARAVEAIAGVTTQVRQPNSRSNNTPSLIVKWDGTKLGIGGREVFDHLLSSDPRINLAGSTGSRRDRLNESSVTVTPWMLQPGDAKTIASRLAEVLARPPKLPELVKPSGPTASVAGRWDVKLEFRLGSANHTVWLEQQGDRLFGTHYGETIRGNIRGIVEADHVEFRSNQPIEGTSLGYGFSGKVAGTEMSGTVDLGEYGEARFTATRANYSEGGRRRG
jgi:L-seryl-tRNA(Ser) seleniumtransferase